MTIKELALIIGLVPLVIIISICFVIVSIIIIGDLIEGIKNRDTDSMFIGILFLVLLWFGMWGLISEFVL